MGCLSRRTSVNSLFSPRESHRDQGGIQEKTADNLYDSSIILISSSWWCILPAAVAHIEIDHKQLLLCLLFNTCGIQNRCHCFTIGRFVIQVLQSCSLIVISEMSDLDFWLCRGSCYLQCCCVQCGASSPKYGVCETQHTCTNTDTQITSSAS